MVKFDPHGGAKIEPSSVEVFYLKSPTVDLTERIKSAVTEKGIDFPMAEAPPGEHHLRVSVADTNGQLTSTEIVLTIIK